MVLVMNHDVVYIYLALLLHIILFRVNILIWVLLSYTRRCSMVIDSVVTLNFNLNSQ